MSRVGWPELGNEYTGFLHRHKPKPGFPEMTKHVVVDLEDWEKAREMYRMFSKEESIITTVGRICVSRKMDFYKKLQPLVEDRVEIPKKRILQINLKKKSFDMIAMGDNKVKIMEVKPFWISRLVKNRVRHISPRRWQEYDFENYDEIHARNGMMPDSPTMNIDFLGTTCAMIGDPGKNTYGNRFIIRLGRVFDIKNWSDPRSEKENLGYCTNKHCENIREYNEVTRSGCFLLPHPHQKECFFYRGDLPF